MKMEDNENNLNQSVINAFKILECFDENFFSYTPRELSEKLNMSASSAWRLIQTLEYLGYLKKIGNDRYTLGLKHLSFTKIIFNNLEIRRVAKPFLELLSEKLKYNVSLGILDGEEVVYLIRIPSPDIPDTYFHIGRRVPIHATALGKALLAFETEEKREKIFASLNLEKFTSNTIIDKEILRNEIKEIHANGYAIDNEEFIKLTKCLAMPIFNHVGEVIAAISISDKSILQKKEGGVLENIDEVSKAAQKISNGMGYSLYNPF
jgi:DNA-binding IclR family transcriptional regulator